MAKKRFFIGALFVCLMFTLFGCGKKGDTTLTVSDADMGAELHISVVDENSDYMLKSTKNGFEISGGEEVVKGSLMSTEDADTMQAEQYGRDGFSIISIDDSVGFACVVDGSYQHVFRPDGVDAYVCLKASESDANIYAAEECISFHSVSEE